MKQRAFGCVLLLLLSALSLAADSDRKHVVLDQSATRSAFPFSDAVMVGNTLYVAGTVGLDTANGKPPPVRKKKLDSPWTASSEPSRARA